ncbi:HAMP domain-containing sensor histidine kinase [Clostridium gasigenes]|uniref:histidine kinase n=1 Tax=Clostridium gasigenes TaxID=94869 RepID=A0A1H0QEW5_9CLOT|nr:HAMP domain-containing sensor histidine kinase [Clostridium gasigenes]SDP15913.1 Signal transduction histidine kinase [Clostridium gasigenes]
MKWKVTGRFIGTIVAVVILVAIINIITIFMVYIISLNNEWKRGDLQGRPEQFVRDFEQYIYEDDGKLEIAQNGQEILKNKAGWIQVLNDNGEVLNEFNVPEGVPKKYTPFEIVNNYKYIESYYINFILEKQLSDKHVNIIIALPSDEVGRITISYSKEALIEFIKSIITLGLIIDAIIALIFGYLFSRKLTKPISKLIGGVDTLAKGEYSLYIKEDGVYKGVFENVNRLADTLKINENEREMLEKMREEWLANITHDIKTPLSSIQGYAEIIGDEEYDFSKEEIQDYNKIIYSKSKYIKELVDDLNLSTRLKNNSLVLNKKNTNLVSLIRNIVIDILNDSRYENRNIEFISSMEVIEKEIDVILIRRAVTNLIFNSMVHNNEEASIKVEIRKKDKVEIIIKDNGRGIKEEELKYIFDRYYRGTNTGEAHKGSGLGLAISKEIIKNHGGEIEMISELEKGTEVNIIL